MSYVVGIDIGTSSTKAVLFDVAGGQIGRCAEGYALKAPEPGAAVQDPESILQAVVKTVSQVVKTADIDRQQLKGLSFSAAMHTLLLVDEAGVPLTPMYTWADNRSDRWSDWVRSQAPTLYSRTGLPIHPMSPVVKLAWLRHEQPDLFARAARIVSIKEFILNRWCGEWVVDLSIASTSGLLNLKSRQWDAGALSVAGIDASQLSDLVPTTHILPLGSGYAQKMNLAAGLPIIIGASDGVLANLGVGALLSAGLSAGSQASSKAAITLGTSGAVRRMTARPTLEEKAQLFCYALTDDLWVMGGAVNNGGIALQWARDQLLPYSLPIDEIDERNQVEPSSSTYERMTKMASAIAPGAEGLLFHPYLLGERAPLWNAQARASFFGIGRHHTQAHFARAVMEGVLFNLYTVFSALESASGPVNVLRASGGFAQSDLWQQMLADIFNCEVQIPTVIESSAYGAAVLAFVALGEWSTLHQVEDSLHIAHTRSPRADNVSLYQRLFPIYRELSISLGRHYTALQQAIKP